MVLVCNNRPAALEVVERLKEYDDPATHVRLVRMHGRKTRSLQELHQDPLWHEAVAKLAQEPETENLSLNLD
jgi:beta-N-acetylhexosaminidase